MSISSSHPPTIARVARSHPPIESTSFQYRRRWWVLAVISLGQLMIALDNTVTNIALPTAQRELGFSDTERQWVVTGYTLAFGCLLLLSGRLADRFGRKRLFIIGLTGFAIVSAVAGASINFDMLVVCRAIQGAFAALVAPAALALLTTTFSAGLERAKAFGIFGAIGVAGTTAGLLVGGVLTEYFSWRSTLYINVFLAVPAVIGAVVMLRQTEANSTRPIDLSSAIMVAGGLSAVVFGCSNAAVDGWDSPITIGSLAIGSALLVLFVVRQTRVASPLLPLRIVLDRMRGGGLLGVFIGNAALLGVILFLAYYVQQILHYSAVLTGLAFLPLPISVVVFAVVIGPRASRRVGPKITIPLGMLLGAISMLLLTRISPVSHYASDLLPSLLVLGAGLGLIFATSTNIATLGVRAEDADTASATVDTAQQVGGSLGVAVLNTIATTSAAAFIAGAVQTPEVATLAAVHSYIAAFWWATGLFVIGAVVTGILLRPGVLAVVPASRPHSQPSKKAEVS